VSSHVDFKLSNAPPRVAIFSLFDATKPASLSSSHAYKSSPLAFTSCISWSVIPSCFAMTVLLAMPLNISLVSLAIVKEFNCNSLPIVVNRLAISSI